MTSHLQARTDELTALIRDRAEAIAELIVKGITATIEHHRPSTATMAFKVTRDPDDVRFIDVTVQNKLVHPKSAFSDLKVWDETENLKRYQVGDDAGQQRLPGAEAATAQVEKLDKFLKDSHASMTVSGPDGKGITLGKKPTRAGKKDAVPA